MQSHQPHQKRASGEKQPRTKEHSLPHFSVMGQSVNTSVIMTLVSNEKQRVTPLMTG